MRKIIFTIMTLCLVVIAGCSASQVSKTETSKENIQNCVSNWVCQEWGSCISNFQTRYCADQNNCIQSNNIPEMKKSCVTQTTNNSGVPNGVVGDNKLNIGDKIIFNGKPITLVKILELKATLNVDGYLKTLHTGDEISAGAVRIRAVSVTDNDIIIYLNTI